ncbi:MAG: DEAD/DEAH box helicase [Myxococcaceae bacterium]
MASTEESSSPQGFAELGLREELLRALIELGYEEPTPIQKVAIPALMAGRDVLGQAATGTGKTGAFALPMLQQLDTSKQKPFSASALVLVPTRELAMQVAEAVHSYGKGLGVSVLPVYGGQPIDQQLRRLKRGVDVVIATPGRALDHLRRKTLKLDTVTMAVVDEADEMLDLGFAEDLDALLGEVPDEAQIALFSATMPPRIAQIAERHLDNPKRIRIEADPAKANSIPKIVQTAYVVPRNMKELALGRVLDLENPEQAIIFCRTRLDVERLTETLLGHGFEASALHGGMSQDQRDRVIKRLKAGQLQLLIATDVAARGLDVEKLSHVINYDLPNAAESYVHRIGRTGRAGREGRALTICEPREHRLLKAIERHTGQKIALSSVPTVTDLRTRRLELTRGTVEEVLQEGNLDSYRAVVEQLSTEADLMDVAAAAISALHARLAPDREQDQTEIPVFETNRLPKKERPQRGDRTDRAERPDRGERPERTERRPSGGAPGPSGGRLFIGIGRSAGLRPGDLVGAITNEANVDRSAIGAIQIADHHAFVEVAEEVVKDVIEALRKTTIRGRKVKVDVERPRSKRP